MPIMSGAGARSALRLSKVQQGGRWWGMVIGRDGNPGNGASGHAVQDATTSMVRRAVELAYNNESDTLQCVLPALIHMLSSTVYEDMI